MLRYSEEIQLANLFTIVKSTVSLVKYSIVNLYYMFTLCFWYI